MIKRTLYFGNPTYLSTENDQLLINKKDTDEVIKVPIEDLGIVVLDHSRITITQSLVSKFLIFNVALITCDETHHPNGLLMTLDGNTLQSQKFQTQIEATVPLKKQLWQQTVAAKILNQANLFKKKKLPYQLLVNYSKDVKSGDSENHEARAAAYYWKSFFPEFLQFRRERFGPPPNNLLNYGYAILRAMVARNLIGSGLLPTLGIFHRNQYNAYCLADDIMEPYRPFVDQVVSQIVTMNGNFLEMTPSMKKQLLGIPAMDVIIDGKKSPLMNATQRSTASLCKCYEGKARKIIYPVLE